MCFMLGHLMSWHLNIWKFKIWLSQEWKDLLKWIIFYFLFHKCSLLDIQNKAKMQWTQPLKFLMIEATTNRIFWLDSSMKNFIFYHWIFLRQDKVNDVLRYLQYRSLFHESIENILDRFLSELVHSCYGLK